MVMNSVAEEKALYKSQSFISIDILSEKIGY